MDGQTPTPLNTVQTEQIPVGSLASYPVLQNETPKGKTHRIFAFEIILFVIIFILLLGVLNYFNILPLSELFPNQLGFLPRRDVPTGTSQQSQQPNNMSQKDVPNGTSQAKQTLINILPSILTLSLIPSSSKEIKIENNKIPESFTSTWTINESTATAILIVTPDGKDIDQMHLSFQKDQSTPPSITTAPTIASTFFSVAPKGTWGCKSLGTSINSIIYCENFWEEDGTKKGIGVEGLFTQGPALINKSPQVVIFFCQRSRENKLYSWKSCTNEFAKTGVK